MEAYKDGDVIGNPGQLIDRALSEREFMAQVVELAEGLGWKIYHTYNSRRSVAGFPDLVLARPPELVFMELKKQKGRIEPEQQAWIDMLKECPVLALIVRPSDWDKIVQVLT